MRFGPLAYVAVLTPLVLSGCNPSGEKCQAGTESCACGADGSCAPNLQCLSNMCVEIVPVCGDGKIDGDELCDDANTANGDYCSSNCMAVIGFCGDGLTQTNEDCDDGNQVDDGNGCSASCTKNAVCGNGAVESDFEACDDGNTDAGDYCSADCITATGSCGDNTKQSNEDCDDGNLGASDGCSGTCTVEQGWTCSGEPAVCAPICGDGLQRGAEDCDDGNQVDDGNGCSASCTKNSACGNGVMESLFEACDDGNLGASDGCSGTCTVEQGWTCPGEPAVCAPICGDGLQRGAEDCDDGNQVDDGNGCSASCTKNSACGNGVTESLFELCDDGLNNGRYGGYCTANCDAFTGECGDDQFDDVGEGVYLNGTESWVEIPDGQAADLAASFTIEFWIRPETHLSTRSTIILSKHAPAQDDDGSWIISHTNDLRMAFWNAAPGCCPDPSIVTTSTVALNEWSHLALVYDDAASKARWYINGALDIEESATFTVLNTPMPLLLGEEYSSAAPNSDPLRGTVFGLRISDFARYDAPFSPARYPSADEHSRGVWHFDETVGSTANDSSSNAVHATLHNEASWLPFEQCDDGNTTPGDGCSATCQTE